MRYAEYFTRQEKTSEKKYIVEGGGGESEKEFQKTKKNKKKRRQATGWKTPRCNVVYLFLLCESAIYIKRKTGHG